LQLLFAVSDELPNFPDMLGIAAHFSPDLKGSTGWPHFDSMTGSSTDGKDSKLLPALDKFPAAWNYPYNLACYACQLGDHKHGGDLLALAFERGDAKPIKLRALDDPDLGRCGGSEQ
jgi:hypothetical protein